MYKSVFSSTTTVHCSTGTFGSCWYIKVICLGTGPNMPRKSCRHFRHHRNAPHLSHNIPPHRSPVNFLCDIGVCSRRSDNSLPSCAIQAIRGSKSGPLNLVKVGPTPSTFVSSDTTVLDLCLSSHLDGLLHLEQVFSLQDKQKQIVVCESRRASSLSKITK